MEVQAHSSYILRISCPDAVGIVAQVAGYLASHGHFIEESSHFGDAETERFFMRTKFRASNDLSVDQFARGFSSVAKGYSMEWDLRHQPVRPKVIIMASKQDHCINDLLYKVHANLLKMEVVAVISNHNDLAPTCEWYGIPFYHHTVDSANKRESEQQLSDVAEQTQAELIILARYMQILSEEFCASHSGHIINIHHSFLPSFKGAKPYHRAFEKGVKLIGATAHYVTAELDEGPIIEQMVERVSHVATIEELVSVGQDVETLTLSRAVKYHIEGRIFLNGVKTVVFK